MSKYANIPHPLFNLPGSSQDNRLLPALDPQTIPVDGRNLADMLDFIYRFSGQVYHYDANLELGGWQVFFADSLPFLLARIHKWDVGSLEQNLQRLSQAVEQQPEPETLDSLFLFIYNELISPILDWQQRFEKEEFSFGLKVDNLVAGNLQGPMLSYIALANGAQKWYCLKKLDFRKFQQQDSWGLGLPDLFAIDEFFTGIPGAAHARIRAINQKIGLLAGRFLEAIIEIKRLAPAYLQESLRPLEEEYQKNHAPHLGLLFTFLLLFQRFQFDLNRLSTRHLEFFYNNILGIQARKLTPDQAHLVFEIQKHLDNKLLSKGLLFLDGKDEKNNDVFFRLEEDIVVDKAQVESLRTLYLNHREGYLACDGQDKQKVRFLEGAYIAPAANSRDGKGEAFKEEGSSWATLGSRDSKYFLPAAPPAIRPEPHPFARQGFVLASPVLLLQEGERKIEILLCLNYEQLPCIDRPPLNEDKLNEIKNAIEKTYYLITREAVVKASKSGISAVALAYLSHLLQINEPYSLEAREVDDPSRNPGILHDRDRAIIREHFRKTQALQVFFSGKEEWLAPEPEMVVTTISDTLSTPFSNYCICKLRNPFQIPPKFEIKITVNLPKTFPAVTFYDKNTLGEGYQTEQPLVKILLDNDLKIITTTVECRPDCGLERCFEGNDYRVSLFHYFRHFEICDTCIQVEVCGVKNLIVQSEENLQDVNDLVQPFGVRPKLNAEFYIGSKEVFCKNWKQFRINTSWKDKPEDFSVYYDDYANVASPITNDSFKFMAAVLDQGVWEYNDDNNDLDDDPSTSPVLHNIFSDKDIDPDQLCPQAWPDPVSAASSYFHEFDRSEFPTLPTYKPGQLTPDELAPLSIFSQKGFLKLVLKGSDFLHDLYAFALAKAMIGLSGGINPIAINELKENIETAVTIRDKIGEKVQDLCDFLDDVILKIEEILEKLDNPDFTQEDEMGVVQQLQSLRTRLSGIRNNLQTAVPPGPSDPVDRPTVVDEIAELNNILGSASSDNKVQLEEIENCIDEVLNLLGDLYEINDDNPLNPVLTGLLSEMKNLLTRDAPPVDDPPNYEDRSIKQLLDNLNDILIEIKNFSQTQIGGDSLPNEPYTPTIKDLSLDYCAKALKDDIQLIHLYPFEGTFKPENLFETPPLFPTFVKEGHLFIGLKNFTPGNNLHLLFQLAESTADSESNAAEIQWHYLRKNEWVELQNGFHVLSDTTHGLTRSGIVKIAVPEDINNDASNTVMPSGLHWIMASAWNNVAAVAETIGVHTQAARVSYLPMPANVRPDMVLKAGSISKLAEADSSLKGINQFYETFGGQLAEASNNFYKRVGEHLRHKGRSIDKYDYERIVLARFPEIYRLKCLNHSFSLSANQYRRDLELAPGFVSLAVIPDINKLKAGAGYTPKAPVSLLNEIRDYLRKKTAPFVRLKVMNPRYERVNIGGEVILRQGMPVTFFMNKLREDLRRFLAPWVDGNMSQLDFGRVISKSEVARFIESLDYVDYICELELKHEEKEVACYGPVDREEDLEVIVPATARSILIGGDMSIEANPWRCPEPNENCRQTASNYKANCEEEKKNNKPQVP